MKFENKIKKILTIFLMIQPLFDIYWLYHLEGITSVFSFSPSTIIRILVFAVLFILFLLDKKKWKTTILFGVVCLGYFGVHHYVAMNSVFYNNDTYSMFGELFYIVRIAIPLYLIFMVSNYDFEDKRIEKIFYTFALIFSAIMIVTNILGIALPAYPYSDEGIKGNIFSWLFARQLRLGAYELATKGIFNMANQISGTMVLIFPILLYYLYTNYSWKKLLIVIGTGLSMYMLGTRVSSYGLLASLVCIFIVYLVTNYKKWDKNILCTGTLLIVFFGIFLYFAPVSVREFYESSSLLDSGSTAEKEKRKLINEEFHAYIDTYDSSKENKEFKHFLKKYTPILYLQPEYFDIYKIEDDREFWHDYYYNRTAVDNRYMEKTLFKHLDNKYGNKKTMLFGHSYTKTFNNGLYLEKDFLFQYYTIGIVGVVLFFSPYILVIVYGAYKILRHKELFNLRNISLLLGITLMVGASYLSGNVMDNFIDTIFLAFTSGLLIRSIKKKAILVK